MTKNIAVKVEHVSKYFKLPTESTQSLRTALVNRFKGIKGYKEQHVLRDINFEVEEGDFFGIVGRNGSGKSTLLKIISQIYVPEQGKATVNGKLVSFIELGVGFNPELTGKENVYLNGAMLGFTQKEIDDMYDDIVDFAELHEFMNQKLKNYSSGMQVRLAFSVAIKAQGDVLILDEVLAVGDEAFQRKCNDYFLERKKSGKTTILVTHDMGAVKKYCNRAVLIEDGEVKAYGDPFNVANQYSFDNTEVIDADEVSKDTETENAYIENLELEFLSEYRISQAGKVRFKVSYTVLKEIPTYVAISFTDIDRGVWIYNDNTMDDLTQGTGFKSFVYECYMDNLNDLKMKLELTVRDEDGQLLAYIDREKIPVIMLNRDDLDINDKSSLDSSTGLLKRNGAWTRQS